MVGSEHRYLLEKNMVFLCQEVQSVTHGWAALIFIILSISSLVDVFKQISMVSSIFDKF